MRVKNGSVMRRVDGGGGIELVCVAVLPGIGASVSGGISSDDGSDDAEGSIRCRGDKFEPWSVRLHYRRRQIAFLVIIECGLPRSANPSISAADGGGLGLESDKPGAGVVT